MSHGQHNPSDIDGVSRSQQTVIGVVVDNADPTETGRVKVRILGEQDDMAVSDEDLPWLPVMTNGFPQMGGVGRFPAGGCYLPGTRIVLRNVGQQGFVVEGSIQSSRTQQGKEDRHPESTSTSGVSVRNGQGHMHRRVHEGSKAANEVIPKTEDVMRVLNEGLMQWERVGKKKIEELLKEAKVPTHYNERPSVRTDQNQSPMPVSVDPWDFATNAQKFVQSIPNAELIKGSVSMLENLKATARQSLNPPQIASLGGMQNILQALQSILQFINKHKPKKKKDEPPPPEEEEIIDAIEDIERRIIDEPENEEPTS